MDDKDGDAQYILYTLEDILHFMGEIYRRDFFQTSYADCNTSIFCLGIHS